jgi:hypothetical protein
MEPWRFSGVIRAGPLIGVISLGVPTADRPPEENGEATPVQESAHTSLTNKKFL